MQEGLSMMDLKGKVALVTGGGTGLGTAIAQRFVKENARVVISGRRLEKLEEVAKTMPKGSCVVVQGDVTKTEDAKKMIDATLKLGNGKIDVLVNNAASDHKGNIIDLKPEDWRRVLDINLTGPFIMMREAMPYMIKQKKGSIINIASLGGTRCLPDMPVYNTSKAGLIMLSQQVALDYGKYGVRVNAVCPGGIDTEMLDEMIIPLSKAVGTKKQDGLDFFSKDVPLRRVSKPEEITGICVYLASDDSAFMTGSALLIDGGAAIVDVSGAAVSSKLG
jgi:meso-butanediol dehydrogenase / (S,S)-butanediol dehydrogenase / diacetyl reductase